MAEIKRGPLVDHATIARLTKCPPPPPICTSCGKDKTEFSCMKYANECWEAHMRIVRMEKKRGREAAKREKESEE